MKFLSELNNIEVENWALECLVIMSLCGQTENESDRFLKIYNSIIKPAIMNAGFEPCPFHENFKTNKIDETLLTKISNSPLVLFDLSNLNFDSMFVLGMRQGTNKPIVLVQKKGSKNLLNISSLSIIEYGDERQDFEIYQENLRKKISETYNNWINLNLQNHSSNNKCDNLLKLILAELSNLKFEMHKNRNIGMNSIDDIKKLENDLFKGATIYINEGEEVINGSKPIHELSRIIAALTEIVYKYWPLAEKIGETEYYEKRAEIYEAYNELQDYQYSVNTISKIEHL